MAGRVLLAAVLSAVLMFLWGFLFWGLLDMSFRLMAPLPAELDVLASLRQANTPSGMYVYPLPTDMKMNLLRKSFMPSTKKVQFCNWLITPKGCQRCIRGCLYKACYITLQWHY